MFFNYYTLPHSVNGFTTKTRSQLKRFGHYKTQRTRREHRKKDEKKKKRFIGFVCMVLLLSMYSNHMNAVVGMPHSAYRNVKCGRCRVGVSVFVSIFCVAYAMFLCDVFCSDR